MGEACLASLDRCHLEPHLRAGVSLVFLCVLRFSSVHSVLMFSPLSAPSALNPSAFLFASLHQCLYQCSSAFISGEFDLRFDPLTRHPLMTHNPKSLNMLATQMAEHIEDLQQRFAELNKRIQLVRSFL